MRDSVALAPPLGHNARQDVTHGRLTRGWMYYQYFGLTEAPFSIAVNPRYLFMSARHRDALAHLLYGVGAGGGFILLTGEVGTGKTTINRCLLEQLPDDTDLAIVLNPALNAMELLATVCDELGIGYDPGNHTLKSLTDSLHAYLLANYERSRKTVLMIDEAQHLDFEVLEQIRLLTNLETNSEKLLQIILIGQPELADLLARPELRQLNQRITARYNLEPLNLQETGAYIQHRLQVAGMTPGRVVFPNSVVKGIYQRTRGIPRLINVLCDRMLLGAYGHNKSRVDQSMLRLAAREVMGEDSAAAPPAWRWPAALALLLVVAGLTALWATGYLAPTAAGPAGEKASTERVVVQPALPETVSDSAPDSMTTVIQAEEQSALDAPLDAIAARPESAPAEPNPVSPTTVTAAEDASTVTGWLLPTELAREQLWDLYSSGPVPGAACNSEAQDGVACIEGKARTWEELARYDRPLMLEMVTPERFAATVVLMGIEDREGWVLADQGVVRLALAEIGPLWTGNYRFYWHPPAGFKHALSWGDRDPAVAEVARLFARLDGQQQALAQERFTSALRERVVLFQRTHELEDDGVVGVLTLLKLNELLEIDATAASARSRLGEESGPVVQR